MAKFFVIDETGTLAEGVTAEGVTAANLDKLLRKGRAHFDVSPVHAMVEPVGVEITPAAISEAMTRPAEAGIRQKAGEVAAAPPKVETSKENAAARRAAFEKDKKDKAVKELVGKHSHPELVKLAKKEKATFSDRGSKEAIATEIVEARQA